MFLNRFLIAIFCSVLLSFSANDILAESVVVRTTNNIFLSNGSGFKELLSLNISASKPDEGIYIYGELWGTSSCISAMGVTLRMVCDSNNVIWSGNNNEGYDSWASGKQVKARMMFVAPAAGIYNCKMFAKSYSTACAADTIDVRPHDTYFYALNGRGNTIRKTWGMEIDATHPDGNIYIGPNAPQGKQEYVLNYYHFYPNDGATKVDVRAMLGITNCKGENSCAPDVSMLGSDHSKIKGRLVFQQFNGSSLCSTQYSPYYSISVTNDEHHDTLHMTRDFYLDSACDNKVKAKVELNWVSGNNMEITEGLYGSEGASMMMWWSE